MNVLLNNLQFVLTINNTFVRYIVPCKTYSVSLSCMFYLLFNWIPNCTVDLILSDKNLSNEDASKNVYSCADFNKWDFKYNFINVPLTYIQAVFWDVLIVVERNWSGNKNQISVAKKYLDDILLSAIFWSMHTNENLLRGLGRGCINDMEATQVTL